MHPLQRHDPTHPPHSLFCPRSCKSKSIILEIREMDESLTSRKKTYHACLTATPVRKRWTSNVEKSNNNEATATLQHIPAWHLNADRIEVCIPHSHRQHHQLRTVAGTDQFLGAACVQCTPTRYPLQTARHLAMSDHPQQLRQSATPDSETSMLLTNTYHLTGPLTSPQRKSSPQRIPTR